MNSRNGAGLVKETGVDQVVGGVVLVVAAAMEPVS